MVREKWLIAPGFVDAHIHIESSMLPPAEFARWAVRHGTVARGMDMATGYWREGACPATFPAFQP